MGQERETERQRDGERERERRRETYSETNLLQCGLCDIMQSALQIFWNFFQSLEADTILKIQIYLSKKILDLINFKTRCNRHYSIFSTKYQ